MADTEALSPRTDALDVIVELLGSLGGDAKSGAASSTTACARRAAGSRRWTRAGLLLYDDARQLVVPVGSHGVEPGLFSEVYGTLEETPIAQVALSEDRVVEVTGDLGRWVPGALRAARRRGDALHGAGVRRRPLARRDLRRPRRHAASS